MATSNTSYFKRSRKWLELPDDVTLSILMKLGSLQILESAQFVCTTWYNLCKEPSMWRTIHIHNFDKLKTNVMYEKMTFNAVDRSAGGLIDLVIEGFGSDVLCSYVASRSTQLKSLRFAFCDDISAKGVMEAVEKLPSLEEVEVTLSNFLEEEQTVHVINSCPFFTTFKFNRIHQYTEGDDESFAIAGRVPELGHLRLIGNRKYGGLFTLVDGCRYLQSLDIRACSNLDLVQCLDKRLSKNIKDLQRPFDSIKKFSFRSLVNGMQRQGLEQSGNCIGFRSMMFFYAFSESKKAFLLSIYVPPSQISDSINGA
ncbi:putative F-box/LRR-repeat protein 9 [Silene latifolia]|uniref:putative F-box/LRR-repeat protein 9 n=1 Tax=Silene latifolia TaxID=37657 RepID=UPI003D7754B0